MYNAKANFGRICRICNLLEGRAVRQVLLNVLLKRSIISQVRELREFTVQHGNLRDTAINLSARP